MTPRKEHGSRRLEDLSSVICFISDPNPEALVLPIDSSRLVVVLEETVVVVVLVLVIIGGLPRQPRESDPKRLSSPDRSRPARRTRWVLRPLPSCSPRPAPPDRLAGAGRRFEAPSLWPEPVQRQAKCLVNHFAELAFFRLSVYIPVDGPHPSLPAASQRSRSGPRAPLTGLPLSPGAVHWPGTAPAR
jgi:hypothetical protein